MTPEALIAIAPGRSIGNLQKALQAIGVECVVFHDLSAALAHLQSQAISLFLADLSLLAQNDFAGLRQLNSLQLRPAVVALAGDSPDDALLARAMAIGVTDYVTEPFDDESSLRRVRLALRKTRIVPETGAGRAQTPAERWQLIFETAQVAIAFADVDNDTFIDVNAAYAGQRGYTREELVGKPLFTIFPEQEWPAIVHHVRKLHESGFVSFETLHRRKDGSIFPVFTQVMTVRDKGGTALFRVAYVIDITDRRKAEEALRATEARLRSTLDNMIEGCQLISKDWIYLYVNTRATRGSSRTPEQIEGKSLFEIWPGIERTPLFEKLKHCMETRVPMDFETRYAPQNGAPGWFNVSVLPVPEGLLVFTLDVTKRKAAEEALQQSEQRFRDLMFTTADLVWEVGLDSRFTYLSSGVKLIAGYEPEELVGKATPFDVMEPEEAERVRRIYSEIVALKQPFHDLEIIHKHKDGTLRYVVSTGVPILDKKGDLLGYRGSSRDVTPRKRSEDQLHAYSKQLQNLSTRLQNLREEERTRISREIHDELGQFLTGIKMDLNWVENRLQEQPGGLGNAGPLVQKIAAASELVDTTVRTVQRIAAELRPGILDTLGLPTALRYEAARFQERTGLVCSVKLPRESLSLSPESATAFFRIFQEALTNVARHAHATQVRAELRLDGDVCHMEIVDNGVGIKRGRAATSLGLLGMEERARALGGWTRFVAPLEGGTAVIVRLPLHRPQTNHSNAAKDS